MAEVEVKPEEIVSKIETLSHEQETSTLSWFKELERESKKAQSVEDQENQGIIKMRGHWSWAVIGFIGAILIFDMVLIRSYGLGQWVFENTAIVKLVIIDNFIKVIGLAVLINKEIFKKIYTKG